MTDARQVHANLVRAAGLQHHPQQRVLAKALRHPVVRYRLTAALADRHARAILAVPTDRRVHRAAGDDLPLHQRQVLAVYLARRELLHQALVRRQRAGHQQQAGGVLVQTMHDAGPRHIGQARIVVQQRVHERAYRIAGARMHHQAGRLVHHQQVGVLVNDVERNRLGRRHCIGVLPRHLHADLLTPAQTAAGRQLRTVHRHPAVADPLLQAAARVVRQQQGQHLVQPLTGQLGGCLI